MTSPRSDRTPDTGPLWAHVDRLTRDTTQRLLRDGPAGRRTVVQHVAVPSLWTQLTEAAGSTNSSDGAASKSTGSRAPLDLAVLDVMRDIEDRVVEALWSHDSPPRQLPVTAQAPLAGRTVVLQVARDEHGHRIPDDRAGQLIERTARATAAIAAARDAAGPRHDVPAELRHLATVIVAAGDRDLVSWWTGQYATWVRQSESALALDDESTSTRGMRGHACPQCGAHTVVRQQDGETFHDAALVVSFRDAQVLHATCRACGACWWRGEGLDDLATALAGAGSRMSS